MKKFLWLIVGIPAAIVLIVFSVANRQIVRLNLNPFDSADPALFLELPFFVFLFLALLCGLVTGGVAVWFSQGRFRRVARRERARADELERREKDSRRLPPAEQDQAA